MIAVKNIVLVNDTTDWYHWGCTCTCTAIRDRISKIGYSIDTVPIYEIYNSNIAPGSIEQFDDPTFLKEFMSINWRVFQKLDRADIVVINGEGTLHGLSDNVLKLLYIAYASQRFMGKKVQIINHSCYPGTKTDLLARSVYKKVYAILDFVAVRETNSADILRDMGIQPTVSFDCLPLFLNDHYTNQTEKSDNTVVISGSAIFSHQPDIQLISHYIEQLNQLGCEVSILTGAKAHPAMDDKLLVEGLKDSCHNGQWQHIDAVSAIQWLDAIASASLFVSGRFHHTIAAAFLDTPFIMLDSNTPKMHALSQALGTHSPMSFNDPDFSDRLFRTTKGMLLDKAGRFPVEKSRLTGLRESSLANFRGLQDAGQEWAQA